MAFYKDNSTTAWGTVPWLCQLPYTNGYSLVQGRLPETPLIKAREAPEFLHGGTQWPSVWTVGGGVFQGILKLNHAGGWGADGFPGGGHESLQALPSN